MATNDWLVNRLYPTSWQPEFTFPCNTSKSCIPAFPASPTAGGIILPWSAVSQGRLLGAREKGHRKKYPSAAVDDAELTYNAWNSSSLLDSIRDKSKDRVKV